MKKSKLKATTAKKPQKSKEKTAKKIEKVQKIAKTSAKAPATKVATQVKVKVVEKVLAATAPTPKPERLTKAAIELAKKLANNKLLGSGQAKVIEPLSWDAIKPKLNLVTPPKLSKRDKEKEEPIDVKSYSIKARYTVGDRVMHDEFGKGLVRDIIGDFKIRVAFRDCEKVLVHGINN